MWWFTWQSGNAKGCSDIFPDDEFARDEEGVVRTHAVEYPDGSTSHARYSARISGTAAVLDYTAHRDFNLSRDMELGHYLINFTDVSRTAVKDVWWQWSHRTKPVPADVKVLFLPGLATSKASSRPWDPNEIEAAVNDYLSMLQKEISGKRYSKKQHRDELLTQLSGRSEQAIEFKHCNISAMLDRLGLPYISGYKPRRNVQNSTSDLVEKYLAEHQVLLSELEKQKAIEVAGDVQIEDVLEEAPSFGPSSGPLAEPIARVVDWTARDAQNRELGRSGEEYVAELEKRHLLRIGRADLAQRVVILAQTQGDGLGYDVVSFNDAGEEKYIEVKTTRGNKTRAFVLTRNEMRASEVHGQRYCLYRVFNDSGLRKIYRVAGPLSETLHLEPIAFRATCN